jgi:hypothetical protein
MVCVEAAAESCPPQMQHSVIERGNSLPIAADWWDGGIMNVCSASVHAIVYGPPTVLIVLGLCPTSIRICFAGYMGPLHADARFICGSSVDIRPAYSALMCLMHEDTISFSIRTRLEMLLYTLAQQLLEPRTGDASACKE